MMATVIDLNSVARQNDEYLPCADPAKVLSVMRRRMELDGLGLQDIVPDGAMHRFALPGERGGKRSGCLCLFLFLCLLFLLLHLI